MRERPARRSRNGQGSPCEHEIAIEVVCTELPGTEWAGNGPVHLGMQKDKALVEAAPADRERIVFRPVFRVRKHTDGSPSFLGPFAHGPRVERFIYLVWAVVIGGMAVRSIGRVKIHLNHIEWTDVEKAAASDEPITVTLALTNAKGKPVYASVRPGAARWEL